MENSIERPANFEVVFGDMTYDESRVTIECPPTTVNNRKKISQGITMPEGEMTLKLGEFTGIIENGKTLARYDNALEKIMTSKAISDSEAKNATKRFMEEKGLTSIKEIIEQSKIINIKQNEEEQDRVG